MFILIILGWLTILTIQTTDLYYKYKSMKEEVYTAKCMARDYKKETENLLNKHFEECKHTQLVHEQLCDAIIKGYEEW